MQINTFAFNEGPAVFYDPKFRVVLEDHMTFLRVHKETSVLQIEPPYAHVYVGDLFGLLNYYQVPPQYHWVIMRMNYLSSPTDYREEMTAFLIPPYRVLEVIRNTFKSQSVLKK